MFKPKVFISHSAKEQLAQQVLADLETELRAAGFDVLLDRTRLQAGEKWRSEIDSWIAECHAAVILLSPAALTSSWVRREATNLSFRASQRPEFALLPLFLSPATAADLRTPDWEPTNLAGIQGVAGDDPVGLVAKVMVRLEPVKLRYGRESPTYKLEERLVLALKKVASEQVLEEAARTLNLPLAGFVLSEDKAWALARRMLEANLEELGQAALVLAAAIDAQGVYEQAAPYAWVNADAASQIRAVIARPRSRAVGLNSQTSLTCCMYVQRADSEWAATLVEGCTSETLLDDLLDQIRRRVKQAVGYLDDEDPEDGELDKMLADMPHFLVVPYPPPDRDVVNALRQTFPNLVYFFPVGDMPQGDLIMGGLEGVELLRPELDRAEEEAALLAYQSMIRQLRSATRKKIEV